MTFDNVNWIITMKKNDHYFPTMELIKDPSEASGWRRVAYENGKIVKGEPTEGIVNATGETFDQVDAGDEMPVKSSTSV
jgi:hypothetical protein